jgi:UDP-3-O-[3-hydroxymyristoyl] glucosamine N-acyltransferase
MSKEYRFSEEMLACGETVQLIRDCSFRKTTLIDKEHEKNRSCITYLTDSLYLKSLLNGEFAGVICTPELAEAVRDSFDGGILVAENPRTAFFEIYNGIYAKLELPDTFIDETALVAEDAKIASKGVRIGAGCVIKSGTVIEENVTIGRDCTIMENCIIGAPAFYYYGDGDDRKPVKAGYGVVIGNRVSLHAGTIVEAGVFRPSFLDDNAKASNRVHIAHDVRVGKNCVLPVGVTLSGLCTLEDNCSLGVGATVAPGVTVGHDAKLSIGAVVTKSVPPRERYSGNFAVEHSAFVAHIKKISQRNEGK